MRANYLSKVGLASLIAMGASYAYFKIEKVNNILGT